MKGEHLFVRLINSQLTKIDLKGVSEYIFALKDLFIWFAQSFLCLLGVFTELQNHG